MSRDVITSRSNALVRELRALADKKERARRGEFLVEGIQPVLGALEAGAPVRLLVVAGELLESEVARAAVRAHESEGGAPPGPRRADKDRIRVVHVSPEVFAAFAEREHPTGLAAVVKAVTRPLEDLAVTPETRLVALYQVSNPGNLGAILRTADAVGAGGVVLIGAGTDPYAPSAVKASRGALFSVPLVQLDEAGRLVEWCAVQGLRIVTTSDRAGAEMWKVDLRPPLVIMFGNEGQGLPDDLLASGPAVRVPMRGAVDSLNLAVAAGVLLYESLRQSRPGGQS